MRLIFIILLFSISLFSNEVTLKVLSEEEILLGERVKINLSFSKSFSLEIFKDLIESSEGQLGPFHVVDIKKLDDENFLIDSVYENLANNGVFELQAFESNITFKIENRDMLSQEGLEPSNKFYVFSDKEKITEETKLGFGIILFSIILILLGIIYFWKTRKIRMQNRLTRQRKNELKKIISKAKTREDFEKIYSRKSEVFELFPTVNRSDDFFRTIDEFQYMKEISVENLNKIKKSLEKIKSAI